MMTNRKKITVVLFCACLLYYFSNPVFQPERFVSFNIQRKVPIGSHKDRVMDYLQDDLLVPKNKVLLSTSGWTRDYYSDEKIGAWHVTAPFDDFLFVHVYLAFVFDKNDKLIAIKTEKIADLF